MADSVLFNGSSNEIAFSKGTAGAGGATTIAYVAKSVSTTPDVQTLVSWDNSQGRLGQWMGGPKGSFWSGAAEALSGTQTFLNTWRLIVYTHPAGSALGRFHDYDGSTWVHENGTGAAGTVPAVSSVFAVGVQGNPIDNEWFNGNVLIWGWKDADTTVDATVETLAGGYQAWIDFGFDEGVRLDALSGLATFTAGSMAETARTGTTLDTGDVPSWWNDTLGEPQVLRPDADIVTTGWSTAPLYSKLNDSSDATEITGPLG